MFYPTFDLAAECLGEGGQYLVVDDPAERILYDPLGLVQEVAGQLGEPVSVDRVRFVEGTGIYEVQSHKGNLKVRSFTWAVPGRPALVRAFEVATLKGNASTARLFPSVGLKSLAETEGSIYLSRLSERRWMAVTAAGAVAAMTGSPTRIIRHPSPLVTGEHASVPTRVTFRVDRSLPAGGYSEPAQLVLAFGRSRDDALKELRRTVQGITGARAACQRHWTQWHAQGELLAPAPGDELDYLWRVSMTLMRTSLQDDLLPGPVGFLPYQGNLWVRDAVLVVGALARAGHVGLAHQSLGRLLEILHRRPDGNFFFSYNLATGLPTEHSHENDTTGLILTAAADVAERLGPEAVRAHLPILAQSVRWILEHRDNTGFVEPCSGISEVFGPHLGQDPEHMVWTSGISAWGLRAIARHLVALGETELGRRAQEGATQLRTVLGIAQRNQVLCRSLESAALDPSVLHLFLDYPLLSDPEVLRATVEAMMRRLKDPVLGGIWRSDQLVTEEGDLRPWSHYTFLLARALLRVNRRAEARELLEVGLSFRSECGLIPELLYSRDMARAPGLSSFGQASLVDALRAFYPRRLTGPASAPPSGPA